jgi:hypothetical protein
MFECICELSAISAEEGNSLAGSLCVGDQSLARPSHRR